jgi:hypothetical protein
MPRYDHDDDDRPRRRDRDSGNRGLLITLGVLGGLLVLGVVGCIGFFAWVGFKAKNAFEEGMQSFVGMAAAETFMTDLQGGRSAAAYGNTTANFKSQMSQKQFDDFLAKNPILTKHQFRTMGNMNPVGQPPVKKVVVSFDLHATTPPDEMDDEDEDMPRPKPKLKAKTAPTAKKAETLKDGKCTVTMVEENGVWKVDALTVP